MPNIRPLRTLDEYNVLPFFGFSGVVPATKGTIVKIHSGWNTEQEIDELGDVGAHWNNTVSQRYGVAAKVCPCAGSGDAAVGIMLYDVREVDENGNKLIFNYDKQQRMQAVLSGQPVPIATEGVFLYSGVNGGNTPVVGVVAGANCYLGPDGQVNVSGSVTNGNVTRFGKFLGVPDSKGWTLISFDFKK